MLIQAAVRLYGSNGFHNTGVRAICREAGLTERYFYESFPHGEALLLAAFHHVNAALLAQIMTVDDASLAPEGRVRRMLGAYFAALRANPTAARVFLVEIVGVDPTIDDAIRRSMHDLSQPTVDVLDPDARGPVSADPMLRRGVEGGLLHIALAWGAEDYERPLDQIVAAAWTLCRIICPPHPMTQTVE